MRERSRRSRLFSGALAALWAVSVVIGFAGLAVYQNTPGPEENPSPGWPADAPFVHPGRPVVLMFVHPRCPCTRSSLEQLDEVVTRSKGLDFELHVFVFEPAGDRAFADTDLLDHLHRIAGAKVHRDVDGEVAAAFGARTSGTVRFFDGEGRLRFHGGITPFRGHVGDAVGVAALLALLQGKEPPVASAPGFGCLMEEFDE